MSVDQVNAFDILAINGASAALTISDLPFLGPVGAVRIGLIGDDFIINPTLQEIEESDLDLDRRRHRRGHLHGRGRRQRGR